MDLLKGRGRVEGFGMRCRANQSSSRAVLLGWGGERWENDRAADVEHAKAGGQLSHFVFLACGGQSEMQSWKIFEQGDWSWKNLSRLLPIRGSAALR